MAIAIITGSGTHALPGLSLASEEEVQTPWGAATVSRGQIGEQQVLHLSRHGPDHRRLSNQVTHRANIWALAKLGAEAVIGCTACGAVDPSLTLGSLIVFDDLHFPVNRLPEGDICTFFTEPGDPRRGHWILHGGPFSEKLSQALRAGVRAVGHPVRERGVYGHVDGPRFNTPTEIAQLGACGVSAVSQTAGPETVLCGELELPYALIGFVTDYANEVRPGQTTPVARLIELMGESTAVFDAVLQTALGELHKAGRPEPAGTVYRFR